MFSFGKNNMTIHKSFNSNNYTEIKYPAGTMSFNELSPAELERLAILSEELGEVQQAIGKILRHGYESTHPDGGPTNRENLERELGDICHAMMLLIDSEDVNDEIIKEWSDKKAEKIKKYLHHNEIST